MNNNKAFTLAEVLVTLGIIGVIAAMTLPTVIDNSRKKQLETAFKKNHSIILQALARYQAEYGYPLLPRDTGTQKEVTSLKNLIKPYLNILHDCGYSYINKCMRLPAADEEIARSSQYYKTYNNNILTMSRLDDGQLVLNDGGLLLFENGGIATDTDRYITVDVNGYLKRPNKWGHDLFTFQLMEDGRLLPMGANGTTYTDDNRYCSISSTNSQNGISCTDNALNEKDYFKNLP